MFQLATLRTAIAAAGLCTAGSFAMAASTSSFGLVLMPDTQFYSRYATAAEGSQFMNRYGSEPYATQTAWLAQNAKSLGIPFVIHLGDVVDQQDKSAQWAVADAAMKTLEVAQVPYSILAGNHDVTNGCGFTGVQNDCTDAQRDLAAEPYLQWFNKTRAQAQTSFLSRDASGFHEAHVFEAQGQKYMVLSLSWRISDAGLQWARDIIRANPTLPVIVSSHELLAIDSDAVTARETDYSRFLWDKLIKDHDQIFLFVSGHNHGSAQLTKTNSFGHPVLEMVVDYQMAYQGGNGYLQMLEFDLTNDKIKSLSFSPWVPIKPKPTLNQFDRAVLTEPNNEFSYAMNFRQRFAGFNPAFGTGTPNRDRALTETVRSMILANYPDLPPPNLTAPFDIEDYPHHRNTLAHWRFQGGQAGQPVAPGTVVADTTGANPMKRAALAGNALLEDALWSSERHAQSANPGSVCVRPGGHFLTEVTAPLNAETLQTGYTVEAIVKMDKRWSAANNAWMSVMTRGGKRSSLPGWSGGWGDSSPLQFAVSNLREFQWEVTTIPSPGRLQSKTNWSGEVMVDEWEHIAIVNDPVTHDTTMYVAGAPVLRNVQNAIGIAGAANQPWVIGAAINGATGGGFFGCFSEVRVTRAALKPEEWLTARKNRVMGTGGRQTLVGTAADDMIAGNQAADTLTGGAGADTFVFMSMRDGTDTITDFTPGEDKLNFRGVLQSQGYTGMNPLADGAVRVVDSAAGAAVQVKVSGSYRTLAVLQGRSAQQVARADTFVQ